MAIVIKILQFVTRILSKTTHIYATNPGYPIGSQPCGAVSFLTTTLLLLMSNIRLAPAKTLVFDLMLGRWQASSIPWFIQMWKESINEGQRLYGVEWWPICLESNFHKVLAQIWRESSLLPFGCASSAAHSKSGKRGEGGVGERRFWAPS